MWRSGEEEKKILPKTTVTIDDNGQSNEVEAEDIQRVARKYLIKENRTVATYTRKAGVKAPNDPSLAGLSADQQAVVRRISKQIKLEKNKESLEQQLKTMEEQLGQAGEKQEGLMKIIMIKI